jgi:hypothetical protein
VLGCNSAYAVSALELHGLLFFMANLSSFFIRNSDDKTSVGRCLKMLHIYTGKHIAGQKIVKALKR